MTSKRLTRITRYLLLTGSVILLAACGGVVTPQPSTTPIPPNTPTASPSPIIPGPIGTASLPLADTATPTLSPTPIIHVIQSGDRLLNIAMEYGVSVEAIQAANGIDDPRFLQIGQTLIIPTGNEDDDQPAGSQLLPTPTPIPLTVQGVAFYETPVGSVWCLGEIVNPTASALTNVQVRVTLFDADGQRMGEGDAFAAADLIPPDQRSPFGILFTTPPTGWSNFQVALVRGQVAGELAASYVPMETNQVTGRPIEPQFEIDGLVQNKSADQTARTINLIATTYDSQGKVIGFRHETLDLDAPLAPGESAPFAMRHTVHGDEAPADYHLLALGHTVD